MIKRNLFLSYNKNNIMVKYTVEERLELLKKAREAKADKYIAKLEDKLANPKITKPKPEPKPEPEEPVNTEDIEVVEEIVYEKIKNPNPKKKIIRKIIQQYESEDDDIEEIVYKPPPKPTKRQSSYEQYARPDIKQEEQIEPKRNIFFNF
tara:strand:- start:136 stop:585 length:450 start_codon:yes stop_codon:yes gene_type:complete